MSAAQLRLSAVLGDHGHLTPLKEGRVNPPDVEFEWIHYQPTHDAFAPMVNDLAFDVCEMAIATYLQARDRGVPITMLPAGMIGRFQHRYLVRHADRAPLRPEDLAGRRIGVRSYTVTTGMWVRGLLEDQYGVDPDSVTWHTYEPQHVTGSPTPPNVVAPVAGASIVDDLASGLIDAAVVGADHPALRPLIDDSDEAARAWFARHRVVPINHLVVVRDELLREHPDLGDELMAAFAESRRLAADDGVEETDPLARALGVESAPLGRESLEPVLALAADLCARQHITSTRSDPIPLPEVLP